MESHQIQWGGSETVTTVEQLDALLDQLHAQALDTRPMLVLIEGPAGELTIGLGYPESVLSFVLPDGDPPYLVSSNKSKDETEFDFFTDGHHSPFLGRHLIPMDMARKAARAFVENGALLPPVRWSEV